MAALTAALVVSLIGSLHCAGMCGPLVAFAVGGAEVLSRRARGLLHVAYHGGRLVTYAAIGAVGGLAGAALDFGGAQLGLQRAAALLAGGLMVGVGLVAILRYTGVRLPHVPLPRTLQRAVMLGQRAALGWRPVPRALTIGLLTAFLPCGWLYMFAFVAAGTGSSLLGAGVMIAFWLGTVPILASVGIGVQALTGTLGRRVPLVTAAIIIGLGLYMVAGRGAMSVAAFEAQVRRLRGRDAVEQLESLNKTPPPCCQDHDQ